MMRKRLALMLESDGPGGAEAVVVALADGLRLRGVDVWPVVFASGQGWMSGQLLDAGFPVFKPSLARPFDPQFVVTLSEWLRHNRIQHIHAHEFTMGFYAGVAGRLSGIPYSITMHGGTGFAKALRRRLALSLSARYASNVVGVSESTCNQLERALWLPRSRIQLVANGVSVRPGNRIAARAALKIKDEEKLLLAVGNLYEVKGHRFLIDAAQSLANNHSLPHWRIVVAGRGDQFDALESQIRAAGLSARVQLLGLRNDIPDLLAAADGWVMSSLSEGLPMALLEAMFAGLPIVSTAVGGIPSVIKDGQNGWLVPPKDAASLATALEDLLAHPFEAARRGALAARAVEDEYGKMNMVDRYLTLYDWKAAG